MGIVNINDIGKIYIRRWDDASIYNRYITFQKDDLETYYTKYSIKETDFRVKTASFTTPDYYDLTTGQFAVLIKSKYHENFAGVILDVEYDEDKRLYTYQCQDFNRLYMLLEEAYLAGDIPLYNFIRHLIARADLDFNPSKKDINKVKHVISGLKPIGLYEQSLWKGNIYKGNPMTNKPKLVIKGKPIHELIRQMVFSRLGYFDVWYNDRAIMQIQPISKYDWENTGLHLVDTDIAARKYKFSTTNAISRVKLINSEKDVTEGGFGAEDLINLDLTAFFGEISASVSKSNKSSATKTKTNAVTNNNNVNNVGTPGTNPFNNKPKRIIVSADNGSDSFRTSIINLLKKDGWSVTDLGTGSDQHSRSYDILDSKYAVNLTIYNGMCAGTIKECYDGWLKGKHEKYGVALVMMWDTHSWTSKKGKNNPKGDWYHRNGDMSDYYLAVAHDWGNGGNPTIPDVAAYFKKYKILYCCGTTPSAAYAQFKAGGYARMKGLY